MPNYQYQCDECQSVFSERKRMSDRNNPSVCPECGSDQTRRKIGASNVSCGGSSSTG